MSSYAYDLVDGENSEDNSCFKISGNKLLSDSVVNSVTKYHIRIRCHDGYGGFIEKTFTLNNVVGIERLPKIRFITIYPNPADNIINIETHNQIPLSIEIYSLSGQIVYRTEMISNSTKIDLTSFSKGVYFVTVRSKEFVRTEKIIIL